MTIALQTFTNTDRRLADGHKLRVQREDIHFRDTGDGIVQITIRVHNDSDLPSRPTVLDLEAAPLGAFVEWSPLGRIPVPRIAPGNYVDVSTEASRPQLARLGDFDEVPPRQLLIAAGPNDRGRGRRLARRGILPADLMELVGQGSHHWAGNLNVFIGGKPVERHRAQSLRIYAGQTNVAMFIVGSGADEYLFNILQPADWTVHLLNAGKRLRSCDGPDEIGEDQWLALSRRSLLFICIKPPVDCERGQVDVHVTQKSSGETAIVEFDLDPSAAGPGCYTL